MRDLPVALAKLGWSATVATPSYGSLHLVDNAEKIGSVNIPYGGRLESIDAWLVPGSNAGVRNLVFDHPLFAADGAGVIYFGDEPERPFATDANKFALFCAASAEWVASASRKPDVVHLHDWHAALFAVLVVAIILVFGHLVSQSLSRRYLEDLLISGREEAQRVADELRIQGPDFPL